MSIEDGGSGHTIMVVVDCKTYGLLIKTMAMFSDEDAPIGLSEWAGKVIADWFKASIQLDSLEAAIKS